MRWSEEQTVLFVKIYLQHEYLWNTKHEHYGHKYLRKKAYKNIASVFGAASDIWLQEREVMAKLRILGSTYAQEVAKIKKRADTDSPYTPSMKWFQYWHRCKYYNEPITDDLQEPDSQKIWIVAPDHENDNEHSTSHEQDTSTEDRESTLKSELEEVTIQDLDNLVKLEQNELNESNIKTPPRSHLKSRWSEDETVKFVQIYIQHEVLWNANHPHHRNNNIRKKAYSKISLEFKAATGMALTDSEVMVKIRSLKSTYCQEVTKIKNKSIADETYKPTMKWFADWDRHFGSKKHNKSQDTVVERQDSDDQKVWLEVSEEDDSDAEKTENRTASRGRRWGDSDTVKFVKIYLQYEFLYNPKHKYFRQKKLRTEAYNNVSSEFEAATGIKLDEKELKAKIKILGSTYAQELSKIKKRAGINQPYKPSMKWFQYWHKRKFAMQQRNARVAMNDTEDEAQDPDPEDWSILNYSTDNEEEDLKSEAEPESPARQDDQEFKVDSKKMKLEDSTHRICPNFVDTNSESLNSSFEREDEFEHYGRYIASILRSMSIDKALQIQLEIQKLLSEARSGSTKGSITDSRICR